MTIKQLQAWAKAHDCDFHKVPDRKVGVMRDHKTGRGFSFGMNATSDTALKRQLKYQWTGLQRDIAADA